MAYNQLFMIGRKFLGVGMQHVIPHPSHSIRITSHCLTQRICSSQLEKSSSIIPAHNRYFFSGRIDKDNQPIKEIPDIRVLELQKRQKQKNVNQKLDFTETANEAKKNQNNKKQKDKVKDNEEFINILVVSSIFSSFTALLVALWIRDGNSSSQKRYQQFIQQERKKKLKEVYGEQKFQFFGLIDSTTQIKEQIKKLFDYAQKEVSELQKQHLSDIHIANKALKFEIIVGISGSGKTTAIKQLLQEYRSQGKKAYYISLKEGEHFLTPTVQQVIENIKAFESLLSEVSKEAKLDNVPIIVLDDINFVTQIKEDDYRMQNFKNYLNSTFKFRVKVFGISSSSDFYQMMKQDKKLRVKFNVLQPLSWEDRRKMLASAIKYKFLVNTADEDLLNFMMEQGYLPRLAERRLFSVGDINLHRVGVKEQETRRFQTGQHSAYLNLDPTKRSENKKIIAEIIRNFRVQDENQLRESFRNIDSAISEQKVFQNQRKLGKALDELVMRKIIEQKQKLEDNNCYRIYVAIEKQIGINPNDVKGLFRKLDIQNLLVFCHPRSKIEWQAFARFLREKCKFEPSEYIDYEKRRAEQAKTEDAKSQAQKQERVH